MNVDNGEKGDIMTAFRRNMNAGGAPEGAERGCGPDPWNLCRSSYRREAEPIRAPLPACNACRIAVFGGNRIIPGRMLPGIRRKRT